MDGFEFADGTNLNDFLDSSGTKRGISTAVTKPNTDGKRNLMFGTN